MIVISNKKRIKNIFKLLFFLLGILFVILFCWLSEKLLYSDNVFHLSILVVLAALLTGCCFSYSYNLLKKKKQFIDYIFLIFMMLSCFIGGFYILKSIVAFRYENSYEIYKMSSNFSVKKAKNIKNSIDSIFEKDFDNVFSRDIFIDNYYYNEEENNYILYIFDNYENYKLKFFVDVYDEKIYNIYWEYNNDKLYFVEKGRKSDNFEFYYAMYIVSEVIGEDVSKVISFEEVIDKKVENYFDSGVNNMVSYEKFIFNSEDNLFILEYQVTSMDLYGKVLDKSFTISFYRKDSVLSKGVWYYGDSSFDYVDYKINI